MEDGKFNIRNPFLTSTLSNSDNGDFIQNKDVLNNKGVLLFLPFTDLIII